MSGTVVAVYSRILERGQDTLVTEDVTVQITNITLEVDEKNQSDTSRTVLKMQHLEAHPALLQAAAGFNDMDSDEDFSDSDEDSDEDDEDDELADADMSKASKASTSSKKAAINGKAADEEDDEEDDDFLEGEEEDEEDSDEEDYDRQEAEVQICSLIPGKLEHFNTNLILPGGEDFVLKVSGKHRVHLFGHYIVQPTPPQFEEPGYDSEDGYEYDSDEIDSDDDDELSESELGMYDPETGLLRSWNASDAVGEEDDDADASGRFMEIEDEPKKAKKAEKKAAVPVAAADTSIASAADTSAVVDKSKLSKNQLKKLAKKEAAVAPVEASKPADKKPETKKEAAAAPIAAATTAAKKAPSKKQTLPSGLVIEDTKAGSGPAAKSGQRVSMRYIGRLNNGKIFDQNTKGAPFSFKLGKGEVIKGMDIGTVDMQVGGERRLTIPSQLAYGKQGVEGIPPNSKLIFELKLLAIK